jgi:hypothetical protein
MRRLAAYTALLAAFLSCSWFWMQALSYALWLVGRGG